MRELKKTECRECGIKITAQWVEAGKQGICHECSCQLAKMAPKDERGRPLPKKFKVGDKVTFTNDYGVAFKGLQVVKVGAHWVRPEQWHYWVDPTDCPWMPKKESSLTLEESV